MKPHSLTTVTISNRLTAAQKAARFAALGPIAARHGEYPKGTVLPETQVVACPRVRIADLPEGFIPPKFYEKNLEHNQQVASCCRHPENHDVEGRKSHPDEQAPDIYVFYCNGCGRKHVRWLLGATDDVPRPIWGA